MHLEYQICVQMNGSPKFNGTKALVNNNKYMTCQIHHIQSKC